MTLESVIKLIIEAAAVLVPSAITVLTLLKKKFYKQTLDNIQYKIANMAITTDINMKKYNLN